MSNHLVFSVWLIMLGSALQWGNIWWTCGVIACGLFTLLLRRRGRTSNTLPEYAAQIPEELFSVPPLIASGPFLEQNELDGQLQQAENRLRHWESHSRNFAFLIAVSGIAAVAVTAWLTSCRQLFTALLLWGSLESILLLFCLGVKRYLRNQLKHRSIDLQSTRAQWLLNHPRPPLCLDRQQDRDHFCRFYPGKAEARWACILTELAGIDFLVYPQDSLRLAAGGGYAQFLQQTARHGLKITGTTFHEVIRSILGQSPSALPEDLAVAGTASAPPLSTFLVKVRKNMLRKNWKSLSEELLLQEIQQRPEMSVRLFCSYWPTGEQAAIALAIRELAIQNMDRPATMMCYPNDPAPLLLYVDLDSLESAEFFLGMEEKFHIRITDAEAEELFSRSFAEIVEYVQRKQTEPMEKS